MVEDRPDGEPDPRSLPDTVEGAREAWAIVERAWQSTLGRARQLPEAALHEGVDDEWSFVETQRHLLFVTDVWVRRSVLNDPAAWHRLGMPPDLRTGQPDPTGTLRRLGIDVDATPSVGEVLAARAEYTSFTRRVVGDATPEQMDEASAHNPPWIPPTTALSMRACLAVVIREGWEHRGFPERDLAKLATLTLTRPDRPDRLPPFAQRSSRSATQRPAAIAPLMATSGRPPPGWLLPPHR